MNSPADAMLTREYRALQTDPSRLDAWWDLLRGWQEISRN